MRKVMTKKTAAVQTTTNDTAIGTVCDLNYLRNYIKTSSVDLHLMLRFISNYNMFA